MPEETQTQTQAPATDHLIETQPEAPVETVPSKEAVEATNNERPEWLPEKFKTAEDLAKSYTALEKKIKLPPLFFIYLKLYFNTPKQLYTLVLKTLSKSDSVVK